jgi:hypothetical protein
VGLWRRPRGGRVAAPPVSESLAGCHCRGPVTGTVNVTSLARAADSLSGSVTVSARGPGTGEGGLGAAAWASDLPPWPAGLIAVLASSVTEHNLSTSARLAQWPSDN